MTDSQKNSPSNGKKVRGIPFTSETGKAYQKSSSAARIARCKLSADLLLENRGRVREIFNEAIATLDADKLEFATKALTFLGVDFRASPDASRTSRSPYASRKSNGFELLARKKLVGRYTRRT